MKMIQEELDKNEKILTVWFDAWRYEKEEYLAVMPFLRTTKIALENSKSQTGTWDGVRKGLMRTFNTFVNSTKLSAGFDKFGSMEVNLEKFSDSLRSDGSVKINGKTVYYHEHPADHLRTSLQKLREEKEDTGFRIVVFIDDLDRCTPEKALEVLESIKSFFDIEGIIYVIGMNYNSIDNIIKKKYGEDSTVNGYAYMEKIIQLPFQIPSWSQNDISIFVEHTISDGLDESDLKK